MAKHSEYRIYDECGHDHREGDPGTTEVNDVGICCEDGYMYSICEKCHTRDGEQHEDSPFEQSWPCEVQQGLDKIKDLEVLLHRYVACWKRDGDLGELIQDVEAVLTKKETK